MIFPSEVETHYTPYSHPKGGIAPLRHKLALYNYVERQKEQRENIPTISGLSIVYTALSKVLLAGSSLLNRIDSQLPTESKPSH
jgi:hypothetical protein